MEPCPDCEAFRQIVDPVPRHVHWCHERIAELEAELTTTRRRTASLDLLLERAESDLSVETARAEKAEAEVERLKAWIDETASALPLTQQSRLREAFFHGVEP